MASFPLNHAHLLLRRLLALNPAAAGPAHHYIYLAGETVQSRHDTDRELPFRQESNFAWLTGVEVPGSAFTLSYEHKGGNELDLSQVQTKLHLPSVDPDEVMWCGMPPSAEQLSQTLQFSSIETGWTQTSLFPARPQAKELRQFIHHLPWTKPPTTKAATINAPTVTSEYLIKALHQARRNKTEGEIQLMRKASEITGEAHTALMKAIGNGTVTDENAAEAVFVGTCRRLGSIHQAYTPIMASGGSAGTLHYVSNSAPFPSSAPGSLILVDAGAEYKNYAADVTRCIPIGNGGRFTPECKAIYELVLEMQEAGFAMVKPGADWEAIQLKMHEVIARGLLKLGIFTAGDVKGSEDEVVQKILESNLTTAFYPHGVGHLLGLDVHDVGGLPEGKSADPKLRYLRLRVPLEPGFVVTVEPGCYFNRYLLEPFCGAGPSSSARCPFLDLAVLERYFYVGGVRIEDNLLVTDAGFENLTPRSLPKTVEQIEAITAAAPTAAADK